jgi:hypothetical protein
VCTRARPAGRAVTAPAPGAFHVKHDAVLADGVPPTPDDLRTPSARSVEGSSPVPLGATPHPRDAASALTRERTVRAVSRPATTRRREGWERTSIPDCRRHRPPLPGRCLRGRGAVARCREPAPATPTEVGAPTRLSYPAGRADEQATQGTSRRRRGRAGGAGTGRRRRDGQAAQGRAGGAGTGTSHGGGDPASGTELVVCAGGRCQWPAVTDLACARATTPPHGDDVQPRGAGSWRPGQHRPPAGRRPTPWRLGTVEPSARASSTYACLALHGAGAGRRRANRTVGRARAAGAKDRGRGTSPARHRDDARGSACGRRRRPFHVKRAPMCQARP